MDNGDWIGGAHLVPMAGAMGYYLSSLRDFTIAESVTHPRSPSPRSPRSCTSLLGHAAKHWTVYEHFFYRAVALVSCGAIDAHIDVRSRLTPESVLAAAPRAPVVADTAAVRRRCSAHRSWLRHRETRIQY